MLLEHPLLEAQLVREVPHVGDTLLPLYAVGLVVIS